MHGRNALFDLKEDQNLVDLDRQGEIGREFNEHLLSMSGAVDRTEDIFESVWIHEWITMGGVEAECAISSCWTDVVHSQTVLCQPSACRRRVLFKGFGIQITEDDRVAPPVHIPLEDFVGVLHVGNLSWPSCCIIGGSGSHVCCADVWVERNNGPRRGLCSCLRLHERACAIMRMARVQMLPSKYVKRRRAWWNG